MLPLSEIPGEITAALVAAGVVVITSAGLSIKALFNSLANKQKLKAAQDELEIAKTKAQIAEVKAAVAAEKADAAGKQLDVTNDRINNLSRDQNSARELLGQVQSRSIPADMAKELLNAMPKPFWTPNSLNPPEASKSDEPK